MVFVPDSAFAAPARWGDGIVVGVTVGPGTPILELLDASPEITIQFGGGSVPDQLADGTSARVTFPNGSAKNLVLSDIEFESGRPRGNLRPTAGQLCAPADCLVLVSPVGETTVDVTFSLVPETTGPLVPVAAVQSDAVGQAFVELVDGSRRSIAVRVSTGGAAIVDGLEVGDTILLP